MSHALLFGVAKKKLESHGSYWPLRVSNVSMAAGGSLLTLVFGVLNMVVAAAWTCLDFLLQSAGPAKFGWFRMDLGKFGIDNTTQHEEKSYTRVEHWV